MKYLFLSLLFFISCKSRQYVDEAYTEGASSQNFFSELLRGDGEPSVRQTAFTNSFKIFEDFETFIVDVFPEWYSDMYTPGISRNKEALVKRLISEKTERLVLATHSLWIQARAFQSFQNFNDILNKVTNLDAIKSTLKEKNYSYENLIYRVAFRVLLQDCLRTSADLDAFILDFYPKVKAQYSAAAMSSSVTNLLFLRELYSDILSNLSHVVSDNIAKFKFKYQLVWSFQEYSGDKWKD